MLRQSIFLLFCNLYGCTFNLLYKKSNHSLLWIFVFYVLRRGYIMRWIWLIRNTLPNYHYWLRYVSLYPRRQIKFKSNMTFLMKESSFFIWLSLRWLVPCNYIFVKKRYYDVIMNNEILFKEAMDNSFLVYKGSFNPFQWMFLHWPFASV